MEKRAENKNLMKYKTTVNIRALLRGNGCETTQNQDSPAWKTKKFDFGKN